MNYHHHKEVNAASKAALDPGGSALSLLASISKNGSNPLCFQNHNFGSINNNRTVDTQQSTTITMETGLMVKLRPSNLRQSQSYWEVLTARSVMYRTPSILRKTPSIRHTIRLKKFWKLQVCYDIKGKPKNILTPTGLSPATSVENAKRLKKVFVEKLAEMETLMRMRE